MENFIRFFFFFPVFTFEEKEMWFGGGRQLCVLMSWETRTPAVLE